MSRALVVVDFINEMVSPEGKLAQARGYRAFCEEHETIKALNTEIETHAGRGDLVVFVGLGFNEGWTNQPKSSPVFGKADSFGILQRGTWSSDLSQEVLRPSGSISITKTRVSAFFATDLESLLRLHDVTSITLAGVATDLAVEAAARDAHDRDFQVRVASAACGASSVDEHQAALRTMQKFAEVDA